MNFYNTPHKKIEKFKPLKDNEVSIYTCGPTVYDYPHVGNWASYIYWDVLVRLFIESGYKVNRVMNITDVGHLVSDADSGEDKLENSAKKENKTAWEIAEFYTKYFEKNMKLLNLLPPTRIAKATDYIEQQLDFAIKLKELGYTYQTTDGIYFDTSKFTRYAEFAHLILEEQKAGARIAENNEKRNPSDFAIWKFTPLGQKRDMEWETPDELLDLPGDDKIMGFPGWHLECSAIIKEFFGNTIDIHTGGIDHIPVHHTNEIAQSVALTNKPLSNYWLHCNHLKVNGGKISKSLQNGYTLEQLADKGYSPMDLKMFVLQGHYQSEGNFSFDNLAAAKNRLDNWLDYVSLRHQIHDSITDDNIKNGDDDYISLHASIGAISEAVSNNLDTPKALSIIDDIFNRLDSVDLSKIHRPSFVRLIEYIDDIFGLNLMLSTPDISDDIKRTILQRQRARDNKNWSESDRLRDELLQNNIKIKDTAHGPIWSINNKSIN